MAASTIARLSGCESVVEVGRISNTPLSTLFDMALKNPVRYECLCLGAAVKRNRRKTEKVLPITAPGGESEKSK